MNLCIKAWFDLQSCRQTGMSVGAILWTAMRDWCDFHDEELDREAKMQLIVVIQQQDANWLDREARKRALAAAARPGGQ